MVNNSRLRERLRGYTVEALGATEDVMRAAVQEMADMANTRKQDGGRLPFLNGHLQNSFAAESPSGGEVKYPSHALAITKAKLGETIILSWSVIYDATQEYGDPSRNIPANGFARTASASFPAILQKYERLSR